ncbi:MAG: hypothetical protein AB7L90_20085 [Hyphomicrobiaceae bacterium]
MKLLASRSGSLIDRDIDFARFDAVKRSGNDGVGRYLCGIDVSHHLGID